MVTGRLQLGICGSYSGMLTRMYGWCNRPGYNNVNYIHILCGHQILRSLHDYFTSVLHKKIDTSSINVNEIGMLMHVCCMGVWCVDIHIHMHIHILITIIRTHTQRRAARWRTWWSCWSWWWVCVCCVRTRDSSSEPFSSSIAPRRYEEVVYWLWVLSRFVWCGIVCMVWGA